jgi:hypothetical protein
MLIIRRLNCINTASGTVTLQVAVRCTLVTCAPNGHLQRVTISVAVLIQFNLWWWACYCSKSVERCNKRIVKQRYCASSWFLLRLYWDARSEKHQNPYSTLIIVNRCSSLSLQKPRYSQISPSFEPLWTNADSVTRVTNLNIWYLWPFP